ncbi:MAG: four helix bundle protein [Prevotellaceae bacterium]|jgi:four helix bundle protein|nr:four helix bundle protein [Prevotellaceae bacterium]
MATIQRFEDLFIWQKARELCQDIFRIINYELFSKDYRLKDQINGSSGSITDNIAEGFERNGNKEFIQFLFIAKGSCGETRSQLYRAFDRKYINQNEFKDLKKKAEYLSISIMRFIQHLQSSDLKGIKYKQD